MIHGSDIIDLVQTLTPAGHHNSHVQPELCVIPYTDGFNVTNISICCDVVIQENINIPNKHKETLQQDVKQGTEE